MKFTIKKHAFGLMQDWFDNNKEEIEIELEPVSLTATQAIYEQNLKNKAFEEGIEYGYKEGFYEGRCPEKRNRYCKHCHCCN